MDTASETTTTDSEERLKIFEKKKVPKKSDLDKHVSFLRDSSQQKKLTEREVKSMEKMLKQIEAGRVVSDPGKTRPVSSLHGH